MTSRLLHIAPLLLTLQAALHLRKKLFTSVNAFNLLVADVFYGFVLLTVSDLLYSAVNSCRSCCTHCKSPTV